MDFTCKRSGFFSERLGSDCFGPPHRKGLALLSCGFSFARNPASDPRLLAFARLLSTHLAEKCDQCDPPSPVGQQAAGLESVVINDVLSAATWVTEGRWRRSSHISVHDTQSAVRAVQHIVVRGGVRRSLSGTEPRANEAQYLR